ncbi:MAG: hypothetical protein LBD67_03420 [Candidatus Accumulibacter sp.]|nr:hypothetical protein [Accumulibacter sp.]
MLSLPNHRHPLSPFVLSLSKYERTLRFSSSCSSTTPIPVRAELVEV